MRRMRAQVDDHNIYRWAGMLLSAVGRLVPDSTARLPTRELSDSQILLRENLVQPVRLP